eukprot:gnl/Spiro4/24511_TR12149_c0_g1_i1.p1 gnl/Spiro4/24511_TR12149_c0_g1~~gnl/Spiro4/24511_TR12149_c0_g1_i1.p1  ORF type:complete len:157 (-),score=27.90 gnl/Spiro4/24511_TR12149_c0_g1_i1:18-446(-)
MFGALHAPRPSAALASIRQLCSPPTHKGWDPRIVRAQSEAPAPRLSPNGRFINPSTDPYYADPMHVPKHRRRWTTQRKIFWTFASGALVYLYFFDKVSQWRFDQKSILFRDYDLHRNYPDETPSTGMRIPVAKSLLHFHRNS